MRIEYFHCVIVENDVLSREGASETKHAEIGKIEVVRYNESYLYKQLKEY